MPFTGKVGDTLFLRDIGGGHQYVILTEPNKDGNVVITNFTTASHFEWLVIFRPKDNPKLFSERCTPNYHDARLYPFRALLNIAKNTHSDYAFCAEGACSIALNFSASINIFSSAPLGVYGCSHFFISLPPSLIQTNTKDSPSYVCNRYHRILSILELPFPLEPPDIGLN